MRSGREPKPLPTPALIAVAVTFGAVAALMLRWSAPAWWAWQALGTLGAVLGGYECRRRRSAAVRGAAGGVIAAVAVVGIRAGIPGGDVVDFDPVSFPVYAVLASVALHVGGALVRRRAASKA